MPRDKLKPFLLRPTQIDPFESLRVAVALILLKDDKSVGVERILFTEIAVALKRWVVSKILQRHADDITDNYTTLPRHKGQCVGIVKILPDASLGQANIFREFFHKVQFRASAGGRWCQIGDSYLVVFLA